MTQEKGQYTLWQILGIWVATSAPMLILGHFIAPLLFPRINLHPGFIFTFMTLVGMIWQFVLALLIVRRELGELKWESFHKRMWIQHPRNPKTGERDLKQWWMVTPALVVGIVASLLVSLWTQLIPKVLPILTPIAYADTSNLMTPEFAPQLVGQWWVLGVIIVISIFNYFLGEEFIFRGVLLPKMKGVFGKWDWVANGFLFGAYHWHLYWNIPAIILLGIAISWFTRRYKCIRFATVMHGFMPIIGAVLLALVIAGVATP
jgi:membrane protease YdiL (CAAX protease family)